jgi:hypothetical protein
MAKVFEKSMLLETCSIFLSKCIFLSSMYTWFYFPSGVVFKFCFDAVVFLDKIMSSVGLVASLLSN